MEQEEGGSGYIRFVSHQLKSPIHAIQSLLRTITEGYAGDIPDQARFTLEKAVSRAGEASEIVDALLDFEHYSREEGIELKEIEVLSIIESLSKDFALAAAEKDIVFNTYLPGGRKVIIRGDARAFEQAVRNLLENAVKYTPQYGKIDVNCDLESADSHLTVTVSDTGEGIPADEQESLFTPFFRSRKHKRSIPGTGLGLAIVKRIVDAHGGTIRAESEEGAGTSFILGLPIIREEELEAGSAVKRRVVIIGGVTSGPKAASRLRRLGEDFDITILEEKEFLSYSGCEIPEFLSSKYESSRDLVSTPFHRVKNSRFFQGFKNITVFNTTKATALDTDKREVEAVNLRSGARLRFPYDELILATGSKPSDSGIAGSDNPKIYTVYSLDEAKRLKQRLAENPAEDGIIIGGGLIGATLAQSLLEMGVRITILEKEERILNAYLDSDMARKLENLFARKGIRIKPGTTVSRIRDTGEGLTAETAEGVLSTDFIILSAGVRPRSELAAEAGLAIGPAGGIQIGEDLRTSEDNIYAVGDCAESVHLLTGKNEYWPLGSVSTKMGRMAADSIAGREVHFRGSLGTTMFRCFDLQVARTGLTRRRAEESGYSPETVVVTGTDNSVYHGESGTIFIKVCCDAETRRVIGAQAIGSGDASGKISLLAACISAGMTLSEVFRLDLGYAPFFNQPIDIVQTACGVLENKLEGFIRTLSREDLEELPEDAVPVFINPDQMNNEFLLPGSFEIHPERIRTEGLPFGKDRFLLLYCRTSALAYQAYGYLKNAGYYNVSVLEGGALFFEE
ncbi:MAG: FAD-dependent oxidoreductase [Spirochaetia bacterium]